MRTPTHPHAAAAAAAVVVVVAAVMFGVQQPPGPAADPPAGLDGTAVPARPSAGNVGGAAAPPAVPSVPPGSQTREPRRPAPPAAGQSDPADVAPPDGGARDPDPDEGWEAALGGLLAHPAAPHQVAEGGVAAAGRGPSGAAASSGVRPAQPQPDWSQWDRTPDGPYDAVAGLPAVHPRPGSVEAIIAGVFPAAEVQRAVAVARCESGLRAGLVAGPNTDGTYDHGLFQLNDGGTLQGLLLAAGEPAERFDVAAEPLWNTRAARLLWERRGWQPWVCAAHLGIVDGLYSSAPGPHGTP